MSIKPPLREQLSDYAHGAWADWMKYLFACSKKMEDGTVVIPADRVERWEYQIKTPYSELSYDEKQLDRVEADKMLRIMRDSDFYNLGKIILTNPLNGSDALMIISAPEINANDGSWKFVALDPIGETKWEIQIHIQEK